MLPNRHAHVLHVHRTATDKSSAGHMLEESVGLVNGRVFWLTTMIGCSASEGLRLGVSGENRYVVCDAQM